MRIDEVFSKWQTLSLIENYEKVRVMKEPVSFFETIQTDGGEFIGETTLNPILLEDGQCQYIMAIVRDITDRKQKEWELKETRKILEKDQKKLTSLIENNGDAVFEFDLNGIFRQVNKMVTQITGYEEEELVGQLFIPLIVEEFLEDTICQFENSLTGNKVEYETWIYHRNGKKIHLSVKNIPITVDGILVGVYGIAKDITAEKRLEKLLFESEQRYKSLFDNHPDAIFSYDLVGNFTSGNSGVVKMTGYSLSELLGESFLSIVIPEDHEKTLTYFTKAIKEKEPQSYEVAFKHKDGYELEVFVMSIPMMIDGQVVGIYGIAKNITEMNRTQKELLEAKEELEVFWEYSVDPVFFINTKGDILKVNPAFEKTFLYSEGEVVEQKQSIVPKHLKSDPLAIDERIRNGESITSHETKRITKNGELLDIIASYTPVRNEKGVIIGATAFYKNVTELKRAERKLLKSQRKYRLITDHAFDVIKMINSLGIVEYVSSSNEKVLGYPPSEYIGKPLYEYIHPEDQPTVEAVFKEIMTGAEPSSVEFRHLHRDGHYIWMEASNRPVLDDGKVTQVVTISRDITERKNLRDKLANMAFYDYLSGLPNRRAFDEQLNIAVNQADRSNKKVAIMMIDGQKFKKINDTYGHDPGDAVIKEMARRIQNSVHETDTVARLGGDEFAVILPELESQQMAENIAKRIIRSFEAPFFFGDEEIKMGAGLGISFYPEHSANKAGRQTGRCCAL